MTDYLDGFLSISYSGIFPVGAVLVEEADRESVLGTIKKPKNTEVIGFAAEPSVKELNHLRAFSQGRGKASKILLILSKDIYDQNWELQKLASSVCRL